jgi:hypothetical protein
MQRLSAAALVAAAAAMGVSPILAQVRDKKVKLDVAGVLQQ